MTDDTGKARKQNYRYWRARGFGAQRSLQAADADVLLGKRRYGAKSPNIIFNPKVAAQPYGRDKLCRWVENAADGLRFVGTAYDICHNEGWRIVDHKGWYLDDDCGDTVQGVVYQLPSRDGKPQFVYGYADPFNDREAFLSFDVTDDKSDAVRWADSMAEHMAEKEREYQTAWRAGESYREALERAAELRKRFLFVAKANPSIDRDPTATRILESIAGEWDAVRRERAKLLDEYGHTEGFKG